MDGKSFGISSVRVLVLLSTFYESIVKPIPRSLVSTMFYPKPSPKESRT